jgi:hypothetical protein
MSCHVFCNITFEEHRLGLGLGLGFMGSISPTCIRSLSSTFRLGSNSTCFLGDGLKVDF